MKHLVLAGSLIVAFSAIASAQSTTRVSVSSNGAQANNISIGASVSGSGRYVVFSSLATNLVTNDTNNFYDVYRHDTVTGQTVLVSANTNGMAGNGSSSQPVISTTGRFVAFGSQAPDLVIGDSNNNPDLFVRDMVTGITELVSKDSSGNQGNSFSQSCAISNDGRFVVFSSAASNLVPNDTNNMMDIFVRDRQAGTTVRVSVDSNGVEGNANSGFLNQDMSISGNNRFVAFSSQATNLVPGDTNGLNDVFVHDMQTGATTRVSIASNGAEANGISSYNSLSYDGRFVAFQSAATNLVPGDTNARTDIFVHDRTLLFTIRASLSSTGVQGNADSSYPTISTDGRWVAFGSVSTNLVPNDGPQPGIFVRDRQTGLTTVESWNMFGAPSNGISQHPAISTDGRYVGFESQSSDLVPNDTNGGHDVFLRDRGPLSGYASYCFGDGTGSSCPCLDSQLGLQEGCPSSLGYGAKLTAHGSANVNTDTFVLDGSQMPNSVALYLQGTMEANNGLGTIFGDGLLCVAGSIIRLGQKTNVNGESHFPEMSDPRISVQGVVTAGSTRDYQVWYRNSANYCTFATSNLSNAIEVVWGPCPNCFY